MFNRKIISSLGLIVSMAAIFTGCGKTTASVETVTEAETKAVVKEEVTTQAPTEAPTEAETEAETEAVTEAVTEAEVVVEAPVEVVTEAPVEVVAEAPVEVVEPATEAVTEAPVSSAQVANNTSGKISDETSSTVTLNSDGTVSSPSGTYSSVDVYNQSTGHTDPDDPEHLQKNGYLVSDKKTQFLNNNRGSTWYNSTNFKNICSEYGITEADLKEYNITVEALPNQ